MAVFRSPILPAGFYWFDDVRKPGAATSFTEWQKKNKGLVVVRKTVDHPEASPPRAWFLFEVKFPALWDQRLGFPSTAPKGGATDEADTVSEAAQPGGSSSSPGLFDGLELLSSLANATPLLVLGAIVWYATSDRR